ncbi:MAG: hypothetical protein ACLVG5_07405 [Clostridium sp.]
MLEPGKDKYEMVINVRPYADGVLNGKQRSRPVLFITDEQAGTRMK